ncbi:MAG: PH domain-containing protein, partial [Flavobacteriales bacterium]
RNLIRIFEFYKWPQVEENEVTPIKRPGYQTLVRLNFRQLSLLGATENHVRSGLIAFALIWGYGSQISEYFTDYAESVSNNLESNLVQAGWIGLLIFIGFFILFSVITSFGRVILKFFNLHAQLNRENLQVKAGLLKRNEHTIPLNKIQIIQWEDNFVRRYFKFKSLRVFQGRSEEAVNSKKIIEVPACFEEQEERVMNALFPNYKQQETSETFKPHIHQARILGAVFSLLGILAVSAMFILYPWGLTVAIPLTIAVIGFLCFKYVKSIKFEVGNKNLYITKGWLFNKEIYFKTYRCQGVEYSQSIFLKRRKLAHLTIYTAAGSRVIRYLHEEDCLKIYNYLLSEIEKHKGSWM